MPFFPATRIPFNPPRSAGLPRAVLAFAAIISLLPADPVFAQAASESGWFNADRTQALVLGIILTGAILLYVVLASAGGRCSYARSPAWRRWKKPWGGRRRWASPSSTYRV